MIALLSLLSLGFAEETDAEETEEEAPPTIEEEVEGWTHFAGLFDLYQDPETGDLKMVIEVDDLDKEYIHFAQTKDGVLEAGHFRGSYRGEMVFRISKSFDKIEFVQENTSFYFNPDTELSRASEANISPSVLAAISIDATDFDENEDATRFLIDANDLFLDEVFAQVKPTPSSWGEGFSLGSLSGDKTKFVSIENYEDNSAFVVDYVF